MPHDPDPSPERPRPRSGDPVGRRALEDAARAVSRARELERRVQRAAQMVPTLEESAVEIVGSALAALGASIGVAMRLTSAGDALELTGAAHVPDDLRDAFHLMPVDAPMPAAEVVRTGEPCYCETRHQLFTRFPAIRDAGERLGLHAVAAMPTRHLGVVHGAVVFGFPAPHRFSVAEKTSLRAFASRYARALRDARRYFAEHDARTAEAAARRAAEEARTVAEAAARAQGDFVAVVSHELRTPLQAILGYADLLADGVTGQLSDQQQEFARRIAMSSLSLLQIVENLLGFSAAQIGRQRLDVEPFDLRRVTGEVMALAEPLAARRGIALRAEMPAIPMRSDPRKLQQILTNLVGNAIKFTECGEVVLSAAMMGAASPRGRDRMPAQVRIAVRDTGPGIAPGDLANLFEPFWQGTPRGRASATGTGLGLSIVRQLARLLGGDVHVESAPGEGSTFTVTLPVVAPSTAAGG